ncbi:hypothetical protein niasHT_039607 [Heterodera trifolii]|uniref:Peptidase A1 domain-containing protein n=1 Tax=Heterodera trifolii TaxID=157864 RepID=A0ABD2I7H1_9BILA
MKLELYMFVENPETKSKAIFGLSVQQRAPAGHTRTSTISPLHFSLSTQTTSGLFDVYAPHFYSLPYFNLHIYSTVSQLRISLSRQTVKRGTLWEWWGMPDTVHAGRGCTSHDAQWCNAQCDPECCGQNGSVGTTTTATQPVPTVTPAAQFPEFRHAETEEPRSCQNLSKFESQKSTSYEKTNMTFSIEYGLGFAAGLIGQDFVQFASDSNETDGLRVCRAYFSQAKLVQKAVFLTVFGHPRRREWHIGRRGLTLGDVDDENCAPITDWIPITPNRFGLWEFQIDKVTLDDGTSINGTNDAVIDSGTSFLIGPFDEVNNILRHYGVDPENGTMPCDQKLGPIIFMVHGQEYKVDEKTLLFDMGDGTCFVGLITFRSLPFWLLGDPFCREYCQC